MDSYEDWISNYADSPMKLKNHLYKQCKSDNVVNDIMKTTMLYSTITMNRFLDARNPKISVKIKKSDIHGNGVFATNNIKKNNFITFYPCHYVVINGCIMGTEPCQDFEKLSKYILAGDHNDKIKWVGDPYKIDDVSRIGHIVNHGNSKNSNAIYQRYQPDNIWIIKSIKNIKKGDEILIDYGEQYWPTSTPI